MQTKSFKETNNTPQFEPASKKALLIKTLLLIIITIAVASNILFFSFDNSVKGVDSPNHLLFSLEFFQKTGDILSDTSQAFIERWVDIIHLFSYPVNSSTIYWPNGLNASTAVFYYILGPSFFPHAYHFCRIWLSYF